MRLLMLFTNILFKLTPSGSVGMLPFLAGMLLSLASSLYTVHRMLRRREITETIMALAIPYVLFGTLFIVEPLLVASLFGAKDLLSAVAFLMADIKLYREILVLAALFAFSVWLFSEAAFRRIGGSRLGQAMRNCGLEILLCLGLAVVSLLAQGSMAPAFLLMDFGLKVFVYALFTVAVKTAVNLFMVLYTVLFRSREEKVPATGDLPGGRALPRVRRFVRRKAGYMTVLLALFLLLFWFAVIRPVNFSLWFVNLLFGWLCAVLLYQALRFLLPDLTVLRRFSHWGDEEDAAALFCREFFDSEPLLKKDSYTITPHYLVDELRFGVKIYSLRHLERQSGNTLHFSDGSRCRLRQSLSGYNLVDHVKEQKGRPPHWL